MEMYGNEISVQQGENWNLDILLSSSQIEYIPFIVSSERPNPFFVVTIASTKYEKNLRYVKSWWNNPLSGQTPLPTFFQTVPYNIGEFESASEFDLLVPKSSVNKDSLKNQDESYSHRYLYQYTLKTDDKDEETGHKPYHYCYYDYDLNSEGKPQGTPTRIDEYNCYVRFNFISKETEQWGSQNYMYQITLVSGQKLADTLESIAEAHGMPDDWPVKLAEDEDEAKVLARQYRYVKVQWPNELQSDIDANSPLGRINDPQVIVPPTKLQVFNNLRKII